MERTLSVWPLETIAAAFGAEVGGALHDALHLTSLYVRLPPTRGDARAPGLAPPHDPSTAS